MSFDPGSPAPLIQNAYGEAAGGPGASSEPAGLYVDIFHENGSHRSVVFTKSEITIGRDKVNDLVLADEGVSRRHAQITVDEHGDCSVVDLGSTNGTIVNDEPIGRATASLDADDLVALGPFGLRVRYVTEPASEPAAAPAGPPQAASPAPPPPKTSPPGPPPPARPSSAPPPQRPGSKLGPPPPARPRSVPPPPPKAARPPPPRSAPPPPQTGPAEPSSPPAAPPPAAAPPSPQPRSPLPAAPEAAPAEVHAGPADGGPPFDEIVDPPTEANTLAELATNNVGRPWDAAEAARLAPTPGQDLPPMPAEASSAAAPDPTSAPQPAPEATAAAEPPDAVPPPSPQAVIAAEAHPPEPVSPEPVSPEPVSLETPEPTGQTTVEEEDLELAEPEIRPSEEEAVADEANLDVLVEAGVCSRFMASSLRDVLDAGLGVLVTGDDSSTEPVVRALAASVGSEDHLVWLVESEEDQPPDEATVAVLGEGEERLGTLEALASLEGDRVVTPPLRGTDLLALLEATSDGCDGLLMAATGHCIEAAVARISASIIAAKPGLDFNAATIWVAAAFPITIEMGCRRDGTRIITRIAELSVETPGAALDLWQYDLEEGFSESAPAPPIREWLKLRGYGTD